MPEQLMTPNPFYRFSPIIDRPQWRWPGNKGMAVYVGLNLEHYNLGEPSASLLEAVATRNPDPINFGWRDYGMRVGVWRLFELFARLDIRPSALLNSDVCEHYGRVIEEGRRQNWAWIAHGKNNSMFAGETPKLNEDQERDYLSEVFRVIEGAVGTRPHGWLGPLGLSETYATPKLLAQLGVSYVLDWGNDDEPYFLLPEQGGLLSVPYSFELNDLPQLLKNGCDGERFARMIEDTFDVLYAESQTIPRVMPICIHPFVVGQPFRFKPFARALSYIAGHKDIWIATSDQIATFFASTCTSR
jgi:allantoinase